MQNWATGVSISHGFPGYDTSCHGIGPKLRAPWSVYHAIRPYVTYLRVNPRSAAYGPLYHHFSCSSTNVADGSSFNWVMHPTGKLTYLVTR
jgi:hypothetical protein